MKHLSQYRIIGASVVLILLLSFNAWFINLNFKNVSAQEDMIVHTSKIVNELDLVLSSAKDAETGIRGFLLTDDEQYLQPYHTGIVEAVNHLIIARSLLQDNPQQVAAADFLEVTLNKRFEILKNLLASFRAKTSILNRNTILFAEGKSVMDSLRLQIDSMKKIEQDLLAARTRVAERSKFFFFSSLIVTTVLSLASITFAFTQIYRNQQKMNAENTERTMTADVAKLGVGNLSLELTGQKSLEYLSKSFGFLAGRVFISNQNQLQLVATHAVTKNNIEPALDKDFNLESSLVAKAFNHESLWEVNNIPESYWLISSSFGEALPKNLIFLPFYFQEQVMGVFELASFSPLAEEKKNLLTKLAPTFGISFNTAQAKERQQSLLERTQQQAEELEAQQEELKTNNEELEQQARALETQQQALNIKNKELERAQKDLLEKAHDLEQSSKYKSDFLAKMSHELRTPLNGLLILSTLLIENKEKNLSEQQRGFARSINSAGNDLLAIINDILDLSKIEARKLAMRPEVFSLESLFQSKRRTFDPQTTSKNLDFITELPEDLKNLQLHTDRQRLEQILRNFLSNAIKFTEAGSIKLKVRASENKEFLTFTVSDTGVGIPKDKQSLIFQAFEQADSSVSRRYGGTGLGLTISRELSALLGGEVSLESEEGQGSHFSLHIPVNLPLESASAANKATSTINSPPVRTTPANNLSGNIGAINSAANQALKDFPKTWPITNNEELRKAVRKVLQDVDFSKKTILIVEDDDKFRTAVVDTVKSYGFSPIEVDDGEVALGVLSEHTPDAILLDIKLPGISGLGILEMIKQLPHLRHVPVHMISVMDYQHNALRMGALGYLTKPVTIEKVRSAIGRIENLLSKKLRRVLLIEDDDRQNKAIAELISGSDIEVISVKTGKSAIEELKLRGADCIILDLTLPDVSGFDLLAELSSLEISLPPVVIYTGKDLSEEEEAYLRRYSESIIIKGARSPERLFDEVNLFLHRVESLLPNDKRQILSQLRSQEKSFEGKSVLIVDDDIRNIFALTSALESKGLKIKVARNGIEALEALESEKQIDLVLMDIMMPKMDGFEAMKQIRLNTNNRIRQLPVIALTAKAMKDDHEKCMAAGANDYLPKPVNMDNLTTVLRVWLTPKDFLS